MGEFSESIKLRLLIEEDYISFFTCNISVYFFKFILGEFF